FPERPGALLGFLERLGKRWNISLFHYRNHGAAQAWVLAALEVPAQELAGLPTALDAMGYQYWDETDNPAYTLFLG
ncbi:threonine ammonia-lyase, biosynthetic, partial [Klebsiella pneumoniae]|nr:threonine ammonia-lyase, biosynthetic [Klebsiella pneumoniae]